MSTWNFRIAGGALAAAVLAACTDVTPSGPAHASLQPSAAQAPAGETVPAAVEWNAVARGLVAKNRSNVFVAFRTYALVSVAQLQALEAADAAAERGEAPSRRAAIAAASVTVLGSVYPGDAGTLETQLQQRLASGTWLERGARVDAASGEAIGRAVGAAVFEQAKSDGYSDPWTGSIPTGPDKWYSITSPPTPPAGASLVDARTYFLTSPAQFRPAPPPAFGSPAFEADLDEVVRFSEERKALTPAGKMMDSIAKFWAMGGGTHTPPGYWNEEAATLAVRHALNEVRAARLLALVNMVAMDAIIASNDAKYTYWLLRPSQADPSITLSINPLPNFPAYPSNHATISAAMAEVIAAAFPGEAARLRAAADQASLSRVYGGIHYRFDGDAGLALGRTIARYALAQFPNVHARQ